MGKRLADFNRKRKKELAQAAKARESGPKLIYGIGAVIAVRPSWLLHLPKR